MLEHHPPSDSRFNTLPLTRYNASKDWSKWSLLPTADKITSIRSSTWREKVLYLRDLTRPRVQGIGTSAHQDPATQGDTAAAKVGLCLVFWGDSNFSTFRFVWRMLNWRVNCEVKGV